MSRTRRRMIRHARQAFDAGNNNLMNLNHVAAEASFREAINCIRTIHRLDENDQQDEDFILLLHAYVGLLKSVPKIIHHHDTNPAYAALEAEARQAMSERQVPTSLDYFIVNLKILTLLAKIREYNGGHVLGGALATFALDQEYIDLNCREIFVVLRDMHEAMAGLDIDSMLTDEQRNDLAACYELMTHLHLQTLQRDKAFEYLHKAVNLRMGAKEINHHTFNAFADIFKTAEHSFPHYDSEFNEICWLAKSIFNGDATFESFVKRSSFLLERTNGGLSKQFALFGTVLDIVHVRMQAGAFELMSDEYFPHGNFRDAMLEPVNQQYFLQVREKFLSINATFARLGRDPSILFSQELEIQRLRQSNMELRQRLDALERRSPQPAQPSAGGMFKADKVRERDSEKDLNPDAGKRVRFGD